jgi:hypothetical protein
MPVTRARRAVWDYIARIHFGASFATMCNHDARGILRDRDSEFSLTPRRTVQDPPGTCQRPDQLISQTSISIL